MGAKRSENGRPEHGRRQMTTVNGGRITANPEVMNTPDLIRQDACNLKSVLSRIQQPDGSVSCRGGPDWDGRCSRRVVPTQKQSFKGVMQRSGNAGGYWVDFLSRGEPPCLAQCMRSKAIRHLTTIICNS